MPPMPNRADIIIRRAKSEDSADLAQLTELLGYPNQTAQLENRLARLCALTDAEHAVFVAQDSTRARICAFLHARVEHQLHMPSYAEVVALVVASDYKRLHLGQQLLSQAENWARSQQMSEVRLYSSMLRQFEAHRFYESLGYHGVRQKMWFRKDL